ncbi:gamma-glutamylcyclotransferase [Oceanobacillus salinisoli]|uniref:gamma-glutamylcyclotransferase n=1 Tax=Oceanobacillus salinisoli TaxID=2678611 RepID=UPI0018CC6F5A|nr:gamma-glutamylcyclotransferase family protein [Oceanobacillus salinisoli]
MHKLFVYGTLLEGERNHHYLNKAKLIIRNAWIYGKLFDTNEGYPVMKQDEKKRTFGSVYEVTDTQLEQINELEGYKEKQKNNLYERVKVNVYNDKEQSIAAITYVSGALLQHASDEIEHGNWKVYNYLKKNSIHYFAYGSCMDDERFRIANVDPYFQDITGKGILTDYGFRFSRISSDGGKADIIESDGEIVEGIIYQVPHEAVDYLYKREGVYHQAYRPAIVTVQFNEGDFLDALTFIGVKKSEETKPTHRYATEIIRGASGILSESYIDKLKERINQFSNKANDGNG